MAPDVSITTKTGDDGTTGLLYGGRVPKNHPVMELNGAIDEAQAMLGLARAECEPGSQLDEQLVGIERDLYVLMAEVATAPEHRRKLAAGTTLVTPEMVAALEAQVAEYLARFEMPAAFVIPGGSRLSAALDAARTVVRRAERAGIGVPAEGSEVPFYLNRLSDLLWAMARAADGDDRVMARSRPRRARAGGEEASDA